MSTLNDVPGVFLGAGIFFVLNGAMMTFSPKQAYNSATGWLDAGAMSESQKSATEFMYINNLGPMCVVTAMVFIGLYCDCAVLNQSADVPAVAEMNNTLFAAALGFIFFNAIQLKGWYNGSFAAFGLKENSFWMNFGIGFVWMIVCFLSVDYYGLATGAVDNDTTPVISDVASVFLALGIFFMLWFPGALFAPGQMLDSFIDRAALDADTIKTFEYYFRYVMSVQTLFISFTFIGLYNDMTADPSVDALRTARVPALPDFPFQATIPTTIFLFGLGNLVWLLVWIVAVRTGEWTGSGAVMRGFYTNGLAIFLFMLFGFLSTNFDILANTTMKE